MLPVSGLARCVVHNRKVGISHPAVAELDGLFVQIVDSRRVEFVGDHQFRFRSNQVSALRSVNQPFLEETLLVCYSNQNRLGIKEQVGDTLSCFGEIGAAELEEVVNVSLMKHNEPGLLPCPCGVHELAREKAA